jgi:hypothetical protein
MELKDVILSTLAEIEEMAVTPEPRKVLQIEREEAVTIPEEKIVFQASSVPVETIHSVRDDEV